MTLDLGGVVEKAQAREYGKTKLSIIHEDQIMKVYLKNNNAG